MELLIENRGTRRGVVCARIANADGIRPRRMEQYISRSESDGRLFVAYYWDETPRWFDYNDLRQAEQSVKGKRKRKPIPVEVEELPAPDLANLICGISIERP